MLDRPRCTTCGTPDYSRPACATCSAARIARAEGLAEAIEVLRALPPEARRGEAVRALEAARAEWTRPLLPPGALDYGASKRR